MAKCTVLEVLFFSFFWAETSWTSMLGYSQQTHTSKVRSQVTRAAEAKLATCDAKCVAVFNIQTVRTLARPSLGNLVKPLGLGESLARYNKKLDSTVQKLCTQQTAHLCSTRCMSRSIEFIACLRGGAGVWTSDSAGTLPSFWRCLQLQRIGVVIVSAGSLRQETFQMLQYTDSFEKYPHLSQLCIKITSVCVHRAGSVPLPRLSPAEFTALWKITFTEFCFLYLGGKVANDQLRICSHVLHKTVTFSPSYTWSSLVLTVILCSLRLVLLWAPGEAAGKQNWSSNVHSV